MLELLSPLLAFLVGSIPTGVLLARTVGVEVQESGSGNIGATNVARTAGKGLGIATLVLDIAKGALPVLVAEAYGLPPEFVVVVAMAAVAGHVFSIFLRFRGGKGVATGIGTILALAPAVGLCAVLVFSAVLAFSKTVSIASLAGALAAPMAAVLLGADSAAILATAGIAMLIVWAHRENLGRLRSGDEPTMSVRKN